MDFEINAALEPWKERIETRLDELCPVSTGLNKPLTEAMRYSLLAPGKRLRPVLTLTSAEAVGGDLSAALDGGCAIEMVHCFSLIHDDLPAIDNDDLRRGRPTLHRKFDEMTAILAGDAIFALAFEVIAHLNATPGAKAECLKILSQAVGQNGLVGGEFVDVLLEKMPPQAEAVQFIHPRKTGALFGAACAFGAILGQGNTRQTLALQTYGNRLGLAFQIADDVLNETASSAEMGKPVGNDREAGKQTYPAVYGLEASKKLAEAAADQAKQALLEAEITHLALNRLADFAIHRTR